VNAPIPQSHILITSRAVHAGSLIVPEDVEVSSMDEDKVPAGAMRDTPESRQALRGAMIRRSLGAGEPFIPGDFLSPGDRGFLAAVLEPGMRAVTVGVDAVTGTAGLIWPGDRVDLLLTQTLDDASLPTDHRIAGETLMEDVRVIAVDQQLVQGAQPGNAAANAAANRTVTLEVSPVDAQRIEVAARIGRLSLTVHPADPVATASGDVTARLEPPQPVFGGDVSMALRSRNQSKSGGAVKVFRGGTGEPVEYRF
jgi:pilus assembly protein CpaB